MQKPTAPDPRAFGTTIERLRSMPDFSFDATLKLVIGCLKLVLPIAAAAAVVAAFAWWLTSNLSLLETVVAGMLSLFFALPVLFAWLILGVLISVPILSVVATTCCRAFWPEYENAYQYRRAVAAYTEALSQFEKWQLSLHEEYWRSLDGTSFEREVGAVYRALGYKVEFTPATGDGGVDLLLRRAGELIAVQCKAHASKVGVSVARELVTAAADYGATRAILVASSGVTRPALEYCSKKRIEVLTVTQMISMKKQVGTAT